MAAIVAGLAAASAALADPTGADVARGAAVFKAQCAACHLQKATDTSPPIGPQLNGVIGRKAGSWDHFKYTDAMRKSGLTWNAKLLDQYLENPYSLVPGAAMGLLVPVEKNRADVIAYLATNPEDLKQKERAPQ
ncbi:MAG TPA: c-type cytochrome [Steroidobacteraceae bacterium]|nr:c-type cytochrome [Steroidobacteraceae bacterium]